MDESKPWWTSKIVWFSVLSLLTSLLQAAADSAVTSADWDEAIVGVIDVIVIGLRFLRVEPITQAASRKLRR